MILFSSYPLAVYILNIGAIDLHFSTHHQFGLKFKFTQFSMNLVAMVMMKQDGRHGFTFSQQRYLKNYYIFSSETNFTFKSNVKPVQPARINDIVQIFIFLVAAKSFSSRKWSK